MKLKGKGKNTKFARLLIKGKNTKFIRLPNILNSPLLRFVESSFVEVNLFQCDTT